MTVLPVVSELPFVRENGQSNHRPQGRARAQWWRLKFAPPLTLSINSIEQGDPDAPSRHTAGREDVSDLRGPQPANSLRRPAACIA